METVKQKIITIIQNINDEEVLSYIYFFLTSKFN